MEQIKLGLLVPAINCVVEPDMYRMAPEGVTVHSTRLQAFRAYRASHVQGSDMPAILKVLEQAGDDAVSAAPMLAEVEPKVIGFADTACSFFKGPKYNEDISRRIEAAAGVKTVTTITSVVEALRESGVKKVCLITPYPEFLTEKAKQFLEASGFEVPVYKCLGLIGSPIDKKSPDEIYELVTSAFDDRCDGVFISCTNFKAVDVLDRVEESIARPVISSNQALMWLMLRFAGVRKQVAGFGRLLTHV